MKKILFSLAALSVMAASASAEEVVPYSYVTPAVCDETEPGVDCRELTVNNLVGEHFTVLEIGPGGRICGPAIVRYGKDRDALTLTKGVCIPAE